jgi:hypothetical protein
MLSASVIIDPKLLMPANRYHYYIHNIAFMALRITRQLNYRIGILLYFSIVFSFPPPAAVRRKRE